MLSQSALLHGSDRKIDVFGFGDVHYLTSITPTIIIGKRESGILMMLNNARATNAVFTSKILFSSDSKYVVNVTTETLTIQQIYELHMSSIVQSNRSNTLTI